MNRPFVSTFVVASLQYAVRNVISLALEGNETVSYKLELISKHGSVCHLLSNATTCRDAQHAVTGVIGIAQNANYLFIDTTDALVPPCQQICW